MPRRVRAPRQENTTKPATSFSFHDLNYPWLGSHCHFFQIFNIFCYPVLGEVPITLEKRNRLQKKTPRIFYILFKTKIIKRIKSRLLKSEFFNFIFPTTFKTFSSLGKSNYFLFKTKNKVNSSYFSHRIINGFLRI